MVNLTFQAAKQGFFDRALVQQNVAAAERKAWKNCGSVLLSVTPPLFLARLTSQCEQRFAGLIRAIPTGRKSGKRC